MTHAQTPAHPIPPYLFPPTSTNPSTSNPSTSPLPPNLTYLRPPTRPRQLVLSDETEYIPPDVRDVVEVWMNRFVMQKPDDALEAALIQAGKMDDESNMFFRMRHLSMKGICWSPRGMTVTGGYYYVVLDTSLHVSLFGFKDDPVLGSAYLAVDLTEEMFALEEEIDESDTRSKEEMKAEFWSRSGRMRVNCIDWSKAPVYASPIGTVPGASLLACGNRAGEISLWTFSQESPEEGLASRVALFDAGEGSWVTQLAWSDWELVDDRTAQAQLAYTGPGIGVRLVAVNFNVTPDGQVGDVDVGESEEVVKEDKRGITGLKWIYGMLFIAKAGLVEILDPSADRLTRSVLSRVGDWAGCSSTSPIAGMGALPSDSALITCWSGENHVIRNISTSPIIDESATRAATKTFHDCIKLLDRQIVDSQREKQGGDKRFTEHFTDDLTFRVGGAELLPGAEGSSVLAVLIEPLPLHDLTIRREGKTEHWFLNIDMSDAVGDDLAGPAADPFIDVNATPPSQLLRFLPKWNANKFPDQDMEDPSSDIAPLDVHEAQEAGQADVSSAESQQTLSYELFDAPATRSAQLKMVETLWQASYRGDRAASLAAARSSHRRVTQNVCRYIVRQVTTWSEELSEDDGAYIRFYLDNAKADMQDLALLEDIAQLEKVAQEMVPDKSLESECPICEDVLEYIPSEDQPWGSLRCGSWHTWRRCDLTLRPIDSPLTRCCMTCHRQTLRPAHISKASPSLEELLLQAAHSCPWCGSSWKYCP